jgi:DNA-directed RNA polymerase specialized sigma subunit
VSKTVEEGPVNARTAKQLEEIKRLLVALLLKLGASSRELASALRVHETRVCQMFPMRKISKLNLGSRK